MIPALEVRPLRKRYGAKEAPGGVDLDVEQGELVGLLGPNGAGKSTLVKIACGLCATEGTATVCGVAAGKHEARSALGYLAELFRFPGWMSADEVLALHQRLAGSPGGAGERGELLALVGLAEAAVVRVEAMSKGMQQRLGVAQALVGSPRLLLLDEPTSALDPAGRRTVRQLLEELRGAASGCLFAPPHRGRVVCDRVAILSAGEVVVAERRPSLRPRGVEVETAAGTRVFEGATRSDVPEIVRGLVADGEDVFAVRPRMSTLEEVYLDAVGDEAS